MVIITKCFIETFPVSDEDWSFPLFGCFLRVVVLVKEECKLQARGIDLAGFTFTASSWFTSCTSKDSICKHWSSNSVKADSTGLVRFRDALCNLFRIRLWVVKESDVHLKVLHWTLCKATLTRDWFVTKVIQRVFHAVNFGCVFFKCFLQVVDQIEVWFQEYVSICIFWFERSNPPCVDSEEESELFCKVVLFYGGSWCRWHPKCLWIGLHTQFSLNTPPKIICQMQTQMSPVKQSNVHLQWLRSWWSRMCQSWWW